MSIALSIDLNSIYYLPDWVCHPTIIDRPFLFQREGAEQGRGEWGEVQRRHPWAVGVLQQRDRFARSAIEVRCSRCGAPKPYISNNDDNDTNNDFKWPDNLNDGTEDTNHNGRIDGDNGDGIYQTTEYWTETNPNEGDTDSDGINDDVELQHNYDPKNKDTDSDGLLDSEEDSLTTGTIGVLDSGETDPTKMDTDGDGLTDSQEINGWTVVITYGATGEVKDRYEINSDPRQVHSDTDQVSDYEEYKNACDPRLDDTDGDGKNDYIEIFEYDDSTPTSIDGTPPNITRLEKDYEIKWGGFLGVIPEGVQLNLDITVKDDFGVKWVNIWVEKLGEKRLYFSDEQVVEGSYDFDIGASDASNFLYKGFKINVSAMDRNDNLGFKDVKMPGITEMVMDALLGPLLAAVKFISELISGIFNWVWDCISSILEVINNQVNSALNMIFLPMKNTFNNFIKIGEWENTKSNTIVESKLSEMSSGILEGDFILMIAMYLSALQIISTIVSSILTGGASNAAMPIINFVIQIILMGLFITDGVTGGSISNSFKDAAVWLWKTIGLPTQDDEWWESSIGIALADTIAGITSFCSSLLSINTLSAKGVFKAFAGDGFGLLISLIGLIVAGGMATKCEANGDYLLGFCFTATGFLYSLCGFLWTLRTDASDVAGGIFSWIEEAIAGIVLLYDTIDLGITFINLTPIFASPLITIINPYSNLHSLLVLIRKQNLTKGPIT